MDIRDSMSRDADEETRVVMSPENLLEQMDLILESPLGMWLHETEHGASSQIEDEACQK